MQINYGDQIIRMDERTGLYSSSALDLHDVDWATVLRAINPPDEERKVYARHTALVVSRNYGSLYRMEVVTVTSPADDKGDEVWTVNSRKERSKRRRSYLILDSQENRDTIEHTIKAITEHSEAISELEASMSKLARTPVPQRLVKSPKEKTGAER